MCNGGQIYLWIKYKLIDVLEAKRKLKLFLHTTRREESHIKGIRVEE